MWAWLLVVLVSFAGGAASTWKVQEWRHGARDAQRLEDDREARRINERAASLASRRFEKERSHEEALRDVILVEVETIVVEPVYGRACFDERGMQQLRRAIDGAAPADSREPGLRLPPAAPASGRDWRGLAALEREHGQRLQPVPGEAPGPGGRLAQGPIQPERTP